MFNWTNTILFNSLTDSSGKAKISKEGENVHIKRVGLFLKDNVIKISKRAASDPVKSKATIDLAGMADLIEADEKGAIFRLALYVRLSGAHQSNYSNALVLHGKPIYKEAYLKKGGTDADLAKAFKDMIVKDQFMRNEFLLEAEVQGTKLIVETSTECQLFTQVEIQKYDGVDFETILEGVRKEQIDAQPDAKIVVEANKEGEGTYDTLIRSIRYPEMEALRWTAINQEELPLRGMKYTQYTLCMSVDRGVLGSDAMGDKVESVSTHVFFVREDLEADFEVILGALGTIEEVKDGAGKAGKTVTPPTPGPKPPVKKD